MDLTGLQLSTEFFFVEPPKFAARTARKMQRKRATVGTALDVEEQCLSNCLRANMAVLCWWLCWLAVLAAQTFYLRSLPRVQVSVSASMNEICTVIPHVI